MARGTKRVEQYLNIVGFDPGTNFGFCWLQIEGGKIRIIESGTWDMLPDQEMKEGPGSRFVMAERYIKYLLGNAKPKIVVYESVMRHIGTIAAHVYGGFEALIIMVAEQKDIPYFKYVPTTIKKNVTGNGRASKEEVADAVRGFFPNMKFRTNDESDAVAIAITGARKQGWLELK